jgi:hypothetical protein
MVLLLTTFCIFDTRHCRSCHNDAHITMVVNTIDWCLGSVMVPLIIFILGTGFNVSRAWSIFTLSIGYLLTWIGIIGVWMLRLLCF